MSEYFSMMLQVFFVVFAFSGLVLVLLYLVWMLFLDVAKGVKPRRENLYEVSWKDRGFMFYADCSEDTVRALLEICQKSNINILNFKEFEGLARNFGYKVELFTP